MMIRGRMLVGWLLVCPFITPAATSADITAEEAQESIRRGVETLMADQQQMGNWSAYGDYPGGATALCTLALLNAGVPKDDPHIQSALRFLRKIGNPKKVYATALQTMVFCAAEPEKDRLSIRRNVVWFERNQVTSDRGEGGWSYDDRVKTTPDNSNSQFAILALNEAQRAGIAVDKRVWQRARNYWQSRQLKDGSWSYRGTRGKGSMTCAGISSLIIAERNLSAGDASLSRDRVVCCGEHQDDESITRGLAWLGRNFSVIRNPSAGEDQQNSWLFYYLYGVERVGRLSGSRYIGSHDWYREGTEFLVQKQMLNGTWKGTTLPHAPQVTTAFALLFLAKGRRPVVISKLKHLPEHDWDRHRQDVANLTRYVEQRWRRDLTWQVIDHRRAGVDDLLQSPILFISGRDGLQLAAKEKESLRAYVEQGGFVFAEACCGGKEFDRDFRTLMNELFPDSPLRLLPPDHPVWFAEEPVDPEYMRELYGVDTCCRTSVVYCPDNLGCYWELDRGDGLYYPPKIREEIDAALGIGANVVAYATNRELRDKLDTPAVVIGEDPVDDFQRGTLSIAKLQHSGGSDDAPAALANMLRTVGSQLNIRVNTRRLVLPAVDESLPDYPVLFLHGRRDFQWSTAERESIAQFVKNGGVIFGDAICASEPFAKAVRRELAATFPDHEMGRIPPGHEMFTDKLKGHDLSQVDIRRPRSRNERGQAKIERVTPVLEGIEINDRYVVIFSPLDISCALESQATNDCEGYTSQDAARIATNVLLYAMQQ